MKKFKLPVIIVIIITFGFAQQSNAQQQSKGLYLTYNDYINRKLSYQANEGNKIVIHGFLGQKNVTVVCNGKKLLMSKSGLFGYHDNNYDYRFFDNQAYKIVDTKGFYLYSFDKLIQQGKGLKPTTVYYFSKKEDSDVLPLTTENIAKAFPQNNKFKFMVEVEAKSNVGLTTYDYASDEYKIKELYNESLK